MDFVYRDYLEKGTKRIFELFPFKDGNTEERNIIISAFTAELVFGITNSDGIREYDFVIYSASIRFIDGEISRILSKENASYAENEAGIKYCARQQQSFSLFKQKGWTLPPVENSSIERCTDLFQKRLESISIVSSILDKDKRIDELSTLVEKELHIDACDQLTILINEFEQDIFICKQKGIPVPAIKNKNTSEILNRLAEIRENAGHKEAVFRDIYDIDHQIDEIVTRREVTLEQCKIITSLCQKQMSLFMECLDKQWPLPHVQYNNPEIIFKQYQHYTNMLNLDNRITQEQDSLSTDKQYNSFFMHCDDQGNNIEICRRNCWRVPNLKNPDLYNLCNEKHAEKIKKSKKRQIIKKYTIVAVVLIVIVGFTQIKKMQDRAGKIVIPFDATYAVGQDLNSIYTELENAGFKNITVTQVDSGWLKENEVLNVAIDYSNNFSKGKYYDPEVNIVINCSGGKRIYLTDILKDWNKAKCTELEKTLKKEGFTNITLKEVITFNKNLEGLTAAIRLDGTSYTNEHCYLSKNAPIVLSYYALQIGIGNTNAQFIGQDYEKVIANLRESGFVNVKTQEVTTGLAKGNTVVGVTVNNVENYKSSDSYKPDVKIVVKYSSNDRVDITEILKNWQKTDYGKIVSSLKEKGIITIKTVPRTTYKKSQDRLVSGITLNNAEYISGDCYIQKSASIKIEYYSLLIQIGQTAKLIEKNQAYEEVVKQLKSQGFINIRIQRSDDIGWFPFHDREGTVKKITINGNRDFTEFDMFDKDAEIIIVVNTRKGKGFEDITEIAK